VDIAKRTVVMDGNQQQLEAAKDSGNTDSRTMVVFATFLTSDDVIDVGHTSLFLVQFSLENLIETLQ
jgi:hypothetical protein